MNRSPLDTSGSLLTQEVWICNVQYGIRCEDSTGTSADSGTTDSTTSTTTTAQTTDSTSGASGDSTTDDSAGDDATGDTTGAAATKPDWRDRRISQLTARLRQSEAKVAAGPASGTTTTQTTARTDDPAEFNRRVREEATTLAAQESFNRQCQDAANAGRQAFPDFDSRINALTKLIDTNDPTSVGHYSSLVSAAIETGQAAQILHHLGGDLNEASRLLEMTPVRLAVELTRMADKLAPGDVGDVTQRKTLAKPITTVGNRGQTSNASIDPDDPERADMLTTAEWMRRREAKLATKH